MSSRPEKIKKQKSVSKVYRGDWANFNAKKKMPSVLFLPRFSLSLVTGLRAHKLRD